MDPGEWDAHEIEAARRKLERYQLAGAKKHNGQPFYLSDFLPHHLAVKHAPQPMQEEEVMARLRLCGFTYTESTPATAIA